MFKGVLKELYVGDFLLFLIDIGFVIDEKVLKNLNEYVEYLKGNVIFYYECEIFDNNENGVYFFVFCLYEIKDLFVFKCEVFGLCVYIICFKGIEFDNVID